MSVDERFMARLFGVLSLLVTIVWLTGYLAQIWRPSYTPPPELNIVMMAIVGVFVSLYTKAKNPRDDEPQEDSPEPRELRKTRGRRKLQESRDLPDPRDGDDDDDQSS